MKLCEFEFRLGADEVKLRAAAVECQKPARQQVTASREAAK